MARVDDGQRDNSMIRRTLAVCSFGLVAGLVAVALVTDGASCDESSICGWRLNSFANQPARSSTSDCQLDLRHTLPLIAAAEETDDTEELSDRDGRTAIARRSAADGTSPTAASFGAAVLPRSVQTLSTLGVRLQI
jgi:hypothetical protein